VVIVRAGGEIDAANEHIWRRLLGEAAAVAFSPGAVVVDVSGLDFMGCCASTRPPIPRCRRPSRRDWRNDDTRPAGKSMR
jgi:hypothetical protein